MYGKSSEHILRKWCSKAHRFTGDWTVSYTHLDVYKRQGLHTFVLSVAEWINKTNAIGLYVKRGKYGGTYAHKDIIFEFASAISLVFKLYLIKEFQRLKEKENKSRQIEWNAKRFLIKNQTDCRCKFKDNILSLIHIFHIIIVRIVSKVMPKAKGNCRQFQTALSTKMIFHCLIAFS